MAHLFLYVLLRKGVIERGLCYHSYDKVIYRCNNKLSYQTLQDIVKFIAGIPSYSLIDVLVYIKLHCYSLKDKPVSLFMQFPRGKL